MAKITHSDMRRGQEVPSSSTYTANTNEPQNYVVADASDVQSSVDQRLAAFGAQPQQDQVVIEKPKVDSESQKKLESLIFMGKYTKEIDLAGHKFEMSTLTHRENNEIVVKLMSVGDAADIFIVRALTLADAIKRIDGVSLDTFDIDGDFTNALERRTAVIDQMQLAMVERLYAAYGALVKEADQVIYGEKIKN